MMFLNARQTLADGPHIVRVIFAERREDII
jgi:hypothetical protein